MREQLPDILVLDKRLEITYYFISSCCFCISYGVIEKENPFLIFGLLLPPAEYPDRKETSLFLRLRDGVTILEELDLDCTLSSAELVIC